MGLVKETSRNKCRWGCRGRRNSYSLLMGM
jgi:hypothetical protein